ncbi:MAG: hypothetical protein HOP08_11945 [Cyclobacteriaceae bacterium]|nr:hypothetical protein [Cyclobacteriaceae bacterium]
MRKIQFLLILCAGFIGTATFAQTESTLYFMNSLPQVMDVNPAIMPRYKLSIGLPGISSVAGVYSNNGFTYNDITSKSNGVVVGDLSKLSENLPEKNYIAVGAQVDVFRFGMRINPKMYLMFSSSLKGYSRSMLPKGLSSLLVDGTGPLVGSYINTAPQQEGLSYLETGIGMAYQASDKFTFGGRLKYLKGIANVTTESSSLVVQVADTYLITATAGANIKTSGIDNFNKSGYNVGDHWGDYTNNTGWGLDLGATYKFMDKLTLGASLIDIGFINWKNNTVQYTLDPSVATYTFGGVDMTQLLNKNSDYLSDQWDQAKEKFKMNEVPTGSYTTMLPSKFYLSGNYELMESLSIGALFFSEQFRDRYSAGMTAAVNKNFGKILTTSLSYTVSNRSYNNIGVGLSVNASPVQLYIVGDNLLRAPVSLIANQNLNSYVNSSQLLTVRAGLNLVFGWDKGKTKTQAVKDDSHNPKLNNSKATVKPTYGRSTQKKKKKTKQLKVAPKSKVGR